MSTHPDPDQVVSELITKDTCTSQRPRQACSAGAAELPEPVGLPQLPRDPLRGQGVARRSEPVSERGTHRRGWGQNAGPVGQTVPVQR